MYDGPSSLGRYLLWETYLNCLYPSSRTTTTKLQSAHLCKFQLKIPPYQLSLLCSSTISLIFLLILCSLIYYILIVITYLSLSTSAYLLSMLLLTCISLSYINVKYKHQETMPYPILKLFSHHDLFEPLIMPTFQYCFCFVSFHSTILVENTVEILEVVTST